MPVEAFYIGGLLDPAARLASAPAFIPLSSASSSGVAYPYPAPYAWASVIALDLADAFTLFPVDLSPPAVAVPAANVIGYVVSRLSPGVCQGR